jgi:alpha-L-fucosidase
MLEWLGLDSASDFDATAWDPTEINDVLARAGLRSAIVS